MTEIIQDNQNKDRPQRVVEKFHSMVCLGNKMADEIEEWKLIHTVCTSYYHHWRSYYEYLNENISSRNRNKMSLRYHINPSVIIES